jgi:hypothetical protein
MSHGEAELTMIMAGSGDALNPLGLADLARQWLSPEFQDGSFGVEALGVRTTDQWRFDTRNGGDPLPQRQEVIFGG